MYVISHKCTALLLIYISKFINFVLYSIFHFYERPSLFSASHNHTAVLWISSKFAEMFSMQQSTLHSNCIYMSFNEEHVPDHYMALLLLGAYGPLVSPNAMRRRRERTPQRLDPCSSRGRTPVLEPSWERTLRTRDAWRRMMIVMMTEQERCLQSLHDWLLSFLFLHLGQIHL